jgi:hypothetical protein
LTKQDAAAAPAPDLIGRDFTAQAPGQRLVGDVTYLPTQEGWLYLATTIDLFNREVVGHAMAEHMRAELVCDAVELAHRRGLVAPQAIRTAHGSAARTRTPTDYYVSTSPKAPTWPAGTVTISTLSPPHSTTVHVRHSTGRHQPKQ